MVEIALAIAVMAIGLVAILGLFSHSLKGSRDSTIDTLQALAAKEILNRAKASSTGILLTNSWAGTGVMLSYAETNASATSYYNGMGDVVTNYLGTTPITNPATLFALKPAFRFEIRTYNTGLTNLPISSTVPRDTNLILLYIASFTPAAAPPSGQGVSTQVFQSLVRKP